MSAVSEAKVITGIRDNVSAGFKLVQKEQVSIRRETRDTKDVLRDTFGKKWSIKLQSIELLRYLRELAEEIALLRKQLARLLQGFGRSQSKAVTPIIVKSAVAVQVVDNYIPETPANKELQKYTWVPPVDFGKSNKWVNETSDRNKFISSFVDKTTTGIAAIALQKLASTAAAASSAASLLSTSFVPLAPVVGLVASECTKGYLEQQQKLEIYGSTLEQQSLYMGRLLKGINPEMGAEEVKNKRDDYIKLLRDNSAETGFDQNDVMMAGVMAANATGGNIQEAIEYVRFAEDIAALNHGSTATEVMKVLSDAKNGNMEGLQGFLPGINLADYKPDEFEGKIMKELMERYKGGVEEWLKTTEGLEARNEMIKLKNIQDAAQKKNIDKRNDEIREYMKLTGDIPIKPGTGGRKNRFDHERSSLGKKRKAMKNMPEPVQSSNGLILTGRDDTVGNKQEMHEIAQSDYQNTKPNIQNQAFTININGVNKSTNEIINEMMPKLKLALANA